MQSANLHPILAQCLANAICATNLQTYVSSRHVAAELDNVHWHTPKMTSIAIYALGIILIVATFLEILYNAAKLRALVKSGGRIHPQMQQK